MHVTVGRASFEDAQFQRRKDSKARLVAIVTEDESVFDSLFAGLIFLNLVVIGVETDLPAEKQTEYASTFHYLEASFLACFIVEFVLRIRLHRKWTKAELMEKMREEENANYAKNKAKISGLGEGQDVKPGKRAQVIAMLHKSAGNVSVNLQANLQRTVWLAFDALLITASILGFVFLFLGVDEEGQGARLVALRAVRVLRIVRSMKLVRYLKDLHLLLAALYCGIKTIFWVVFLLGFVTFLCAIFLCRSLGRDSPRFESIGMSMFTLFQIMTLDGWGAICTEAMDEGATGIAIFFVMFIIFTHFTVLNLFVAVIVEHVQQFSSVADYELILNLEENQARLREKLMDCFITHDSNKDNQMSAAEFRVLLKDPDVQEIVKGLGIDEHVTWLFEVLDVDKTGYLNTNEFLDGIITANSSELARQLMQVQHTVIGEVRRLQRHIGGDPLTPRPPSDSLQPRSKTSGCLEDVMSNGRSRSGSKTSAMESPMSESNVRVVTLETSIRKLDGRLSDLEEKSERRHDEMMTAIAELGSSLVVRSAHEQADEAHRGTASKTSLSI